MDADMKCGERCKGLRRVLRYLERATNALKKDPRAAAPWYACQMAFFMVACSFVFWFTCFWPYHSITRHSRSGSIPTIAWATIDYMRYEGDNTMKCFHEGEFLECNLLAQGTDAPNGVDAYLFYGTKIKKYPLPRDPKIIWALLHEESPRNNVKLMSEKGLNLFNFSATYSQHSDVPMPLVYLEDIDRITELDYFMSTSQKNERLSMIAPVIYLQSDCYTSTQRDVYVRELMKYIKVDSYGLCLHNRNLPLRPELGPFLEKRFYLRKLNEDDFLLFMAQYKFAIAIENGVCDDYITEKLWRPLRLGVVPVYLGAGNVREWLPHDRAALLLEDYPTPALMAARIKELNENDTLYEQYLDHKFYRRIANKRLVEEVETRSYQLSFFNVLERLACLVCVRLHENSTRVNIVTKKHYNCSEPISAMTLSVDPDNRWRLLGRVEEESVEMIYEKIEEANKSNRSKFFLPNPKNGLLSY